MSTQVSGVGRTNNDWYSNVGLINLNKLYEELAGYTNRLDRINRVNDVNRMLGEHALLRSKYANSMINPTFLLDVKNYQKYYHPYNEWGIANAFQKRIFTMPGTRTSGDNNGEGNYRPDGYYSGITDWRYLLGRDDDLDDAKLKEWNNKFKSIGYYLDKDRSDNYYRLKPIDLPKNTNTNFFTPTVVSEFYNSPIMNPQTTLNPKNFSITGLEKGITGLDIEKTKSGSVKPQTGEDEDEDLSRVKDRKFDYSRFIPNLLEAGVLAGDIANNNNVAQILSKGLNPALLSSFGLHRQVIGDEGTRQGYYRRAAQGESRAARPFTSDADRLMAYLMEAKRIGDELRALGDLVDNLRIRETLDESNKLTWGNIERDNKVANENIMRLADYRNKLANIEANRISANWLSQKNYIQGNFVKPMKESNAEYRSILNLMFANLWEDRFANDERLIAAREKYKNATTVGEKSKAAKEIQQLQRDLYDEMLASRADNLSRFTFLKQGGNIVAEFKKTHQKNNTIRMLLGGIFPFTVYTPTQIDGAANTSSQSSRSSKSSKSDSDDDDILKKLFSQIALTKGLDNDVSRVFNSLEELFLQRSLFGDSLGTNDISTMYLDTMASLVRLENSKQRFDAVEKNIILKDALNEFAVTSKGYLLLMDKDGNLKTVNPNEIIPGTRLLTNNDLLNLRRFDPTYTGATGDRLLLDIVSNGIGINKIAEEIKNLVPTLGSTLTLEGDYGDILLGLLLLEEDPNAIYKTTNYSKTQTNQMKKALNFVLGSLSPAQKSIIQAHGMTPEEFITSNLGARETSINKDDVTARTKGKSTSSSGGSKTTLEMNYALKLLTGASAPQLETYSTGSHHAFLALSRSSVIADVVSEVPFGADFSYTELYKSGVGQILDYDNASFGDVPINKAMKNRIIVDNSKIVGVDLPYRTLSDGKVVPDFNMLDRLSEADTLILKENLNPDNPKDLNRINLIYADKKLPIKYNELGKVTDAYKRFAVIQATADEDAFLNKEGLGTNGTLQLVTDDAEILNYITSMINITGDKDFSLDRPSWFTGDKAIYKGSIFIPITGDITDAAMAGSKVSTGFTNEIDPLRVRWNTRNYVAPPEQNTSGK